MKNHDIIDLEGIIKHETEKAILFVSADTGKEAWIPKSVVEIDEYDLTSRAATIQIPESMALDKELI